MELGLLVLVVILLVCVVGLQVFILRSSNRSSADVIRAPLREEIGSFRDESAKGARAAREELSRAFNTTTKTLVETLGELGNAQRKQLESVDTKLQAHQESNEKKMEKMRETLEKQLHLQRESNEAKLEKMRETVDEKLQATLEKRLGASFKHVSERLEAVQKGLGEMQALADGVGDLKRVLTNVKSRGTWGEVQLGSILEDLLTADQYDTNVKTKKDSNDLVEFAIRLPGPSDDPEQVLYLPIDSKFPQEDYLSLLDAVEKGDGDAVERISKSLGNSIKSSAKVIREKYIDPPHTTDFAIMFLPTEGLYAEVLRRPGLMEEIQNEYRVVITGPTTLSATVSSFKLGFRTLAIEKRSSEVWNVLAAVKTEFQTFGKVMDKIHKQLQTVSGTVESTQVRTRAMDRKLREVEQLPTEEAKELLGLSSDEFSDEIDEIEEGGE